MTEQHVHEFGPPKLATDGGGGSFRQCACGYYSSITFVDGWEQGRATTLAELRAKGLLVHADMETGAGHGFLGDVVDWRDKDGTTALYSGDALGMKPGKNYVLVALEVEPLTDTGEHDWRPTP